MVNSHLPKNVYQLPQSRFRAIDGSPWIYRINDSLRSLFKELPSLGSIAQPKQGFASADNFRFIRFWWEVGFSRIGFNFENRQQAYKSDFKWFPCMKSGGKLWYTSQFEVVNWHHEAKEMQSFKSAYIRNPIYHFREGAAYSSVSNSGLSFRWMPSGFICEHATNAIYSNSKAWSHLALVGLFNSALANYVVRLNETINVNIKDLLKMPICKGKNLNYLEKLVKDSICLRIYEDSHNELYLGFISPILWEVCTTEIHETESKLSTLKTQIDNEVFDLYQISIEDRKVIESELRKGFPINSEEDLDEIKAEIEEADNFSNSATVQDLAISWISYAIGIALGRFYPGDMPKPGSAVFYHGYFAIGSLPAPDEQEFEQLVGPKESFSYIDSDSGWHVFSQQVEQALCDLALPNGIAVLDENHPFDLAARVQKALELMLGDDGAGEVISTGAGGDLRKFLEKEYFTKYHLKWYRSRPVYWYIQSSRRSYGFVIFHEKITKDTFYAIQRDPFLDTKRNAVNLEMQDVQARMEQAAGSERKRLEKRLAGLRELADELAQFAKDLEEITLGGYEPEPDWIDDGVILRMAPLWRVIPQWKSEPKKYWERLEKGDFDWSHIAMKYWPERVRQACRKNKSFAIAHGHEEWYEGR